MTIVDSLSRFARFIPCKKSTTGEKAFQLIWQEWIQVYGRPVEIHSDNDVRFQGERGWYQGCMRALKIKITFSTPRRPQANGLCEQTNRKFIQTMRILMAQQKSRNWLKLIPYCTFVMNNQYTPSTGFTPSDLFFGRPSWQPDVISDSDVNPSAEEWLSEQMSMQEHRKKEDPTPPRTTPEESQPRTHGGHLPRRRLCPNPQTPISAVDTHQARKSVVWTIPDNQGKAPKLGDQGVTQSRRHRRCSLFFRQTFPRAI